MAPHSPSKSRPPPLSPAQASRHRQRSSFVTGAAAGGASVALLALMMVLASSRNFPSPTTSNAGFDDSSSCPRASQAPLGSWFPRSAAQASAAMLVTASAVNALRESGALPASKGYSSSMSAAASATKKGNKGSGKKKNKKPTGTTEQSRPVLPSSLNGLATLALDGDGGDVEVTAAARAGDDNTLPTPRATVIVPLQSEREARAAAATALSAAAAFAEDNDFDADGEGGSLEVIIVAADAEVARALSGTSAEAQEGVRLVVRDAAAARIAGQKQMQNEGEDAAAAAADGDDDDDDGSSSSGRPFLLPRRRAPLPPLLPRRPPQLGGGGSGDAALRNAGARAARAGSEDLLVFLKPGVVLRPGYWRSVLSAAAANPRGQLFFTGRRASPTLPQAREGGNGENDWAARLPWHNPYAFSRALCVRRSAWVLAGGFSPAAAPGVDVEALLLSALDAPPRIERVDAKGDLEKEEGAGPSGKGTIASSGEPHGYLFAVQASKRRLAGVEGERDEDYSDDDDNGGDSGRKNRADEENKAKGARSLSSPLFATSLALVTAHHPLPPQHLLRAHAFLEDGVSGAGENDGPGGPPDPSVARDVRRAAAALAAEGCPLSAGGDLLTGLVASFAGAWDEAGRAFQRAGACASPQAARVPSLAWQAGYLNDAVRRNVLELCVKRSAAALEPGMPGRPRREAAKADAGECVALLVGV